jgi:hypothetical protein
MELSIRQAGDSKYSQSTKLARETVSDTPIHSEEIGGKGLIEDERRTSTKPVVPEGKRGFQSHTFEPPKCLDPYPNVQLLKPLDVFESPSDPQEHLPDAHPWPGGFTQDDRILFFQHAPRSEWDGCVGSLFDEYMRFEPTFDLPNLDMSTSPFHKAIETFQCWTYSSAVGNCRRKDQGDQGGGTWQNDLRGCQVRMDSTCRASHIFPLLLLFLSSSNTLWKISNLVDALLKVVGIAKGFICYPWLAKLNVVYMETKRQNLEQRAIL